MRKILLAVTLSACLGAAPAADAPRTLRVAAEAHHLLIGAAAGAKALDDPEYASILAKEFSQLEPENEMKFYRLHPEPDRYDYEEADKLVAFAAAHGMKVRGTNFVWYMQLPKWITEPATPWTPAALNQVLKDHIQNVAAHYKGKVYAWDVVNEPFNDDGSMRPSVWYDQPGIGYAGQGTKLVEQALTWTRETDPEAKLFVNEYGAETINAKSNALYAMARDFLKRGVPLDGIGFEVHVGTDFDSFASLGSFRKNVSRFAALGLQIQFTEVDVRLRSGDSGSLTQQAWAYRDLLRECLRQPACTAFQIWGITDKDSWIPAFYPGYGWALPFDKNYKKKPAYKALLKKLRSHADREPRPLAPR
jgi:endo-1,4-beta-xylanase